MSSLDGHLLVASPHMSDPNFSRTVVLIVQHSDEGAFGVVLNRPSKYTVRQVWEKIGEEGCDNDRMLRLGGPVEGPLLALHAEPALSEREVLPGIHFSAQKEALCELVVGGKQPLLLISGYSGWSGGQLEGELKAGAWLTCPARAEYVFFDDDELDSLWRQVAGEIGHAILFGNRPLKHEPEDPSLN